MRFFSLMRLALHTLFNNKVRTLLTVIVLSVVSFVIVLLVGIGYSFYESTNQNINQLIRSEGAQINVSAYVELAKEKDYTSAYVNGRISHQDLSKIINKLEGDEFGYINTISLFDAQNSHIWGSRQDFYTDNGAMIAAYATYFNSNPFLNKDGNYLDSGRMWNKADNGTKSIWMTVPMMSMYSLGDTITIYTNYEDYKNDIPQQAEEFKIEGFLDLGTEERFVFIDYSFFDQIERVFASLIPQEGMVYGAHTTNFMRNIVRDLNKLELDQEGITEGTKVLNVYSNIVDMLEMTFIIFMFIAGVVVFISLIIIMLSIGSVANTIKISAEQGRKFFGVMKAIGMKNKSLRQILTLQIVIMTIVGVAIASLAAFLVIGVAETMLTSLITSMFYQLAEPIIICNISFVIPIAVALVLIGFVLAFTRKNLSQFSRMDVITVINEVN